MNAINRILQNPGFRLHLIIYVAVNVLLLVVNLLTSPDKLWFYWPLLGWGIGLAGHAFLAYRHATRPIPRINRPRGAPGP
jgi:hypothetical protein